ncbi:hypothetical protein BCR35DRAFT_298846 [Leucosporidium creatinivorum]|uniref:Ser-Thr-rich glycosyl-phosphatidyl-inositol-anchored membrane family-domain-containing protein n=1 Tax=Leucosporidium creatinivorum TaxID=106004 RepID=A0A1Y2G494_9BASI|nr:hypothetical protein BCR35DRAFT_298846 [Leucosporidium creatinivorum]
MRSTLPSPFLPAVSFALLLTVAQALVVTLPTSLSDWDTTGTTPIYIQWALYPLTFPAPASQFFDIYIRNGVGGMYEPFLNQSLALSVDASTSTYYEVPASEAVKFVVGTGYQLFFSDPNDASVVYCDSEVFSIGVNPPPATNSSSSASSASSTDTLASSTDSSSSTDSTSTLPTTSSSSTDSLASSTELTTSPTASPSSSTSSTSSDKNRIVAATVPGGTAQQGQNLLFSAGSRVSLGGASIAAAVVAAGLSLA